MLSQRVRNTIALIAPILSIALCFYYLRPGRGPSREIESMKRAVGAERRLPKPIYAPAVSPWPKPTKEEASVPLPPGKELQNLCQGSWREFLQLESALIQVELQGRRPILEKPCLEKMNEEERFSAVRDFLGSCQLELAAQDPATIEGLCFRLIDPLKALISRFLGSEDSLEERSIPEPAYELMGGLLDLPRASLEELDHNIALADALLDRDPDYYDAYKGKLLSQLLRELKYNKEVDVEGYQEVYDELWRFRVSSDQEELMTELRLSENSPVDPQSAPELDGLDPDLVRLPFLRLKALGDYESLERMAEAYVEAWPESYVGRLYLAEALWAAGEKAQAVRTLRERAGDGLTDEAASQLISAQTEASALEQIPKIRIK